MTRQDGFSSNGVEWDVPSPAPLSEPLLDAAAAAAARLLGVRPSWIYEAVRDGRLPHVKIGRHIRFLRSDLEEWVLSRRAGGSARTLVRRRN